MLAFSSIVLAAFILDDAQAFRLSPELAVKKRNRAQSRRNRSDIATKSRAKFTLHGASIQQHLTTESQPFLQKREKPAASIRDYFSSMLERGPGSPRDNLDSIEYRLSESRPALVVFVAVAVILVACCSWCVVEYCAKSPLDDVRPRTSIGKRSRNKRAGKDALVLVRWSSDAPLDDVRREDRKRCIRFGQVVYCWTQTSTMIAIYIETPPDISREDLEIKMSAKRVEVGRKGKLPFMHEETYDAIDKDASSWRLSSSGELQLVLQKMRHDEEDWPSPFLDRARDCAEAAASPAPTSPCQEFSIADSAIDSPRSHSSD